MRDTTLGRYALLWLTSQMHLLELQPGSMFFRASFQQLGKGLNKKSKRGVVVAETLHASVAKVTAADSDVGRMVE